jgi:predicted site-specific integrase-resolvase
MEQEKAIKINYAAELAGVSQKTIYNWISWGYLRMYHPGFVLFSEVRRAQIVVANIKTEHLRNRVKVSNRDALGRFSTNS